jgi:7,8-dihydropterin-6-yl-methyl-4-(beta-D-ribofuranosyl)aminobenzene 5'-phosphate synthase
MPGIARIIVLAENSVQRPDVLAEHGLAFWIEMRGRCLLFDTGQGNVLTHNADKLGVPLARAEAVVLSHGHYDHTGGVDPVLQVAPQARVYLHPAAYGTKYVRAQDGTSHIVGMTEPVRATLRQHPEHTVEAQKPTEIGGGLSATGEIPRRTDFEDTGGPFFLDPGGRQADPLVDDQAMFFETRHGTVVLLGCAHAGIINTLQYIHELTDRTPIHAVMGGTHLVRASDHRMTRTIAALRALNVERLGPAHCTGLAATAQLWNALPGRCFPLGTGTRIEFELT